MKGEVAQVKCQARQADQF